MAYDPNDAADKKIVDDAVEAATAGLVKKRDELLTEVKELRKGGGSDAALQTRLERAEATLTKAEDELAAANTAKKALERDLAKATASNTENAARADKLIVAAETSKALIEAKIAPQFAKAVEAMFMKDAVVKGETVLVGDKPILDVIKEFAATDEGKHFVGAPQNSGGGGGGGNNNAGSKVVTRQQLDGMDQNQRHEFFKGGGTVAAS